MTTEPFTISRTFKTDIQTMWKLWTTAEGMDAWFGPKGAVITKSTMDLRPGGTYHYAMEYAGNTMWGKFTYREVTPPSRLVWLNSFSDEHGGIQTHPMKPGWPRQMITTLTLDETAGGTTTVTIEWLPYEATATENETFEAGRAGMQQGWTGTFEQLESYINSLQPKESRHG